MASPDQDGDGYVTITECSEGSPCSSSDTFYNCEAGAFAKHTTITYEDGIACTTWEQCIAPGNPCGSECTALSPAPTATPTLAPSSASVVTDCRGQEMEADDYRLDTWLGDDFCDKGQNGDFNCAKWGYDCCDCRTAWWQECEADDYAFCSSGDRRARRKLQAGLEPVFSPSLDETRRGLGTTTMKTTACASCSLGEYCPPGTTEDTKAWCPSGHYCPSPSEKKECPANHVCNGAYFEPCIEGMWCPPGATRKQECPPGHFCSEPQYKLICPAGEFCRGGDTKGVKCSWYESCPEGTHVPKGTATTMIIFLSVLLAGLQLLIYLHRQRLRARAEREEQKSAKGLAEEIVLKRFESRMQRLSSFNIVHEGEEATALDSLTLKPDKTKIGFEFSDLSLVLNSGQKIIEKVTGKVGAAKMTAIMGPSGCGKTTMLNVLRDKAAYGQIGGVLEVKAYDEVKEEEKEEKGRRLDEKATFHSIAPLQRIVGFVPQEDILHSELTVREAIMFSSLLRNRFSSKIGLRKKEMVEDVIDILGLGKCSESVIGDQETRGVSGGQRKRVSIAVELVANPSICFLDEPTSGLDSTTSIELIEQLKQMTSAGMTIVMVIHQPRYEIFEMIDDVLLLGQNGKPVYMGQSSGCLDYFKSKGFPCPSFKSPADHFLDVMSGAVKHSNPDFTTAMLSDWWEESLRGSSEAKLRGPNNPLRSSSVTSVASAGSQPPPIPASVKQAAQKRRASRKQMSSESKASTFLPMSVVKEGGGGEGTKADRARACLAAVGGAIARGAVSLSRHVARELKEAAVAFKPSMLDKFRTPPNNAFQFSVCAYRSFRQVFAANRWADFVSDCLMLVVVGAVLGSLFGVDEDWKSEARKLALRNFTATLGIALTSCLRALGTFGNERPMFWRERNSGVSTFSYFLGKALTDMIFIVVFPVFFLFLFFAIAHPRGLFMDYYKVMFWLAWAASGQGYLLSMLFSPETAKFNGLLSCLLCMMFAGVEPTYKKLNKGLTGTLLNLSFARWSCEGLTVLEFKMYPEVYDGYVSRTLNNYGWETENLGGCMVGLMWLGIGFRVLAFLFMKLSNRNK